MLYSVNIRSFRGHVIFTDHGNTDAVVAVVVPTIKIGLWMEDYGLL